MLTRKRAVALSAFLATLAIVPACNDQTATEPQLRPRLPARDGAAMYQTSFGVQPTNDVNNGSFGPVPAGLIIPARARYIVRVTGSLTVSLKPNLPCGVVSAPGVGTYGPRSYDREMGLQILDHQSSIFINLYYRGGDTTVFQSDTMYTPITTDLDLWRNGIVGGVGCSEGSASLYQMSGSQTISVEVIEVLPQNGIVLKPDSAVRIGQGDSLVFTVSKKYPISTDRLEMRPPLGSSYAWSFLPDSSATTPHPAPQTIPGCYIDASCNFKATVPGTITAYGSFSESGPATDSASVHVDVFGCPWKNDPIINSWEVRAAFVYQFALSDTTQLERGGGIYRDDVSGGYLVDYKAGSGYTPTQCRFPVQTAIQPGYTLVAIWHTHPIAATKVFTNCPNYPPGSTAAKGPSDEDYAAQKAKQVPEYIMDPTDVYRIVNNAGRSDWLNKTTSMPWKSCPNWAP